MYRNNKVQKAFVCFSVCIIVLNYSVRSQVVAGIRANGIIRLHGDTISVCKGSSVIFQSAAQGSLNVSWKFKGGSPSTGSGIAPIAVSYNTNGYDTTFQKVVGGAFSDSTFIIVFVSDVQPFAGFSFSPDNACGNENIQFTSNASGNLLTWLWSFGDAGTSTIENPSHQFLTAVGLPPASQVFPVKLVVTNSFGCRDSVTHPVTIRKIPDASLGNPDPSVSFGIFNGIKTFKKCSNIPFYNFKFQNLSATIPNNVNYTIKWGDGSPDSVNFNWGFGQVIGHTFPLGGSKMIVSINGADGCTGIKEYAVFLGTSPSGGLVGPGNTDICSSDSLYFTIANNSNNPNPPGTIYSVLINDGSSQQVFQHPPPASIGHHFETGSCFSVSTAGIQTYSNAFGAYLTIENPCGSTSGSVVPIYVSGKPKPLIHLPTPVVCVNTNVNIINASSYGNVISSTGTYTSDCINNGIKVWEIFPATGYSLISGSLGSLNGSPNNGASWSDGSNSLNILFTSTGTYTIKIHIYNDRCGIANTTRIICVRNPPQASFSLNQHSSCSPVTITPVNTSPIGGCQGDDYEWTINYSDPSGCAPVSDTSFSFMNGTSNASAIPDILFKRIGRYVIRLAVRAHNSPYGCPEVYAFDTFYVKGPPVITLPQIIPGACVNNSITPVASVLNCYSPGPYGYQWTFTNGSPGTSGSLLPGSIQYGSPGTHPVQLIVTDSSCMLSDTASTNVVIVSLPVAEAGNDISLCSIATIPLGTTPSPGVVYQWSPSQGLSNPGISNPIATLNYNGNSSDTIYVYHLSATLGTNCTSLDSVKITVRRKPVVTVTPSQAQVCTGTNISLTAMGADTYSWNPSATLNTGSGNNVIASPLISTTYTVTGLLTNGCMDDESITVTVHPDADAAIIAGDTLKCAPVNIDTLITNIPFPAGNGTYTWFANGIQFASNSTGVVPSYIINQPEDTLTIKLLALSAHGCKPDSVQKTFITRPSVTSAFTKDRDSSCAPLAVVFTNTSTSMNQGLFYWNFGNGITTTLAQPGTVTFNTSPAFRDTVYHIVLKAYNGCDTTYHRDSVKVFANSKARFAVDTTRGCSPFTLSVLNTSLGNNYAYYWDFGDGNTDTTVGLTSFTHTYYTGVITTYVIRLISENQCSRDTQMINIVVSPNVIQPFITANGNQLSGCAPHLVTFNNSTIGASQLTWNFGDNTPQVIIPNNQNSITHVYANQGNYTVTIRLQNDCSDTTIQRSVSVYDPPIAGFIATPIRICTGQPLTVTNSSSNANSYDWFWGDGTSSQFTNGQHTYNSAGVYNIMMIAKKVHSSGFTCTDTITKQVTVVNMIRAHITVAPGKFCAPYTLSANAGNISGYDLIKWVVYDSSSSQDEFHLNGPSATHVYNVPGVYSVKLVVITTSGCADSATYSFRVYSTPKTTFGPNHVKTCSHDTTVTYSAVTTNHGNDPVNYKWFTNGSIEGTSNPFVYNFQAALNSASPVEFAIRAVAENIAGCGDTSLAGKLIINPLPHPFIEVGPSLVIQQPDYTFSFRDTVSTNPHKTYVWNMGDPTLQTRDGQQVSYEYGDTGRYKVKLLVTDFSTGCKASDSVKVTIQYIPGFLHVPNAMCLGCSNFSLRQFLPLGKGMKTYKLRIYNSWGQKIFETSRLDANGSPSEPWDGIFKKQPLQQDVYTWQIEATYINDTEWKGMLYPGSTKPVKAGFITIIK